MHGSVPQHGRRTPVTITLAKNVSIMYSKQNENISFLNGLWKCEVIPGIKAINRSSKFLRDGSLTQSCCNFSFTKKCPINIYTKRMACGHIGLSVHT